MAVTGTANEAGKAAGRPYNMLAVTSLYPSSAAAAAAGSASLASCCYV